MSDEDFFARIKSFLKNLLSGPTWEERAAWADFFFSSDEIIRACVRRVHPAWDVVDDITQSVWVKLIKRLPRLRFDAAQGSLKAWVATIATREALRRAHGHPMRRATPLSPDLADELLDREPGPDATLEQMQEHELFCSLVAEFSARLPEPDRQIVMMYWVEACVLSAIALHLNMLEDAVWWVLRRIKPKLMDHLRRGGLGRT